MTRRPEWPSWRDCKSGILWIGTAIGTAVYLLIFFFICVYLLFKGPSTIIHQNKLRP